jgi:hypothetical protein
MAWTAIVTTMKHDSTQDNVLNELEDKINFLLQQGWICVGDMLYHKNAVSQIMVELSTSGEDLALMRPAWDRYWALGSFKATKLEYAMGGCGHMGVKTKYNDGQYYDL